MIKKEIAIGFILGLLVNAIGLVLATLLFGEDGNVHISLKKAYEEGFLGKLISMGAIFNLFLFFYFLRKKRDYRARGVLLATFLAAIVTFVI